MRNFVNLVLNLTLIGGLSFSLPCVPLTVKAQEDGYLHTDGSRIVDSGGKTVLITGISWFGMETESFAPHGLWARNLESFLDQIVDLGFNTIRLPFSNQLFDPGSTPNGINYDLNPELNGLTGLEIMDRVIQGAGERGLKIILDRHRPDSHAQSELWYTADVSEERWIGDWVMLAERYAGDDTVIGMDLHNEPRGQATWGSSDPATDWRLAAERAGNAILEVNPNLLIIVQGIEQYQGEFYWWGGNLMGVRDHPVRLSRPTQLIYSPHTYGPGVYPQQWFSDPAFPDNMPEIWDRHWGFVHKEGLAPIILGEFGGRSLENDQEGIWQRSLVEYLRQNQISYLYWTMNPNSGDTGGILLDDWESIDPKKKELLSSFQFPLIGSEAMDEVVLPTAPGAPKNTAQPPAEPSPAATIAAAATVTAAPTNSPSQSAAAPSPPGTDVAMATSLKLRYHTSNPAAISSDSKPEFIIANHSGQPVRFEDLEVIYWFLDDPGQTYTFQCDWAQIGCEKILGSFEARGENLHALRIRFQPGAVDIQPGAESGEIKLRFNRNDWSQLDQSDDYSFNTSDQYVEWDRVSLYHLGQLVWGSEPGLVVASATPEKSVESPAAVGEETPTVERNPSQPVSADKAMPGWWIWAVTVGAFAAGFLIATLWLIRRKR